MSRFTVNGREVECTENKSLMDYLRDDLRLTSVKNGCNEGACGTCTVILDGTPRKACVLKTDKVDGKTVQTVEGLSDREKDVFAYAFGKVGAVQCGFCIPGMVMCGKALIDKKPDPTPADVKDAIKNNICRCTGYKKIEEGIMLAARMLREDLPIEEEENAQVGQGLLRTDAKAKVLAEAVYTDDLYPEGLIYGSAVRSPYARCRIISIDTSEAEKHPDFVCVATKDDIPGAKVIGHLVQDWPVLNGPGDITHSIGDALVLIASRTKKGLEEMLKSVKVEAEELPTVTSPEEALAPGAPQLHEKGNILCHEHLIRGDAEEKIKNSKYVYSGRFYTPWTEHAFLEPECAVAVKEGDRIHIFSSDQGVYQTRHECSDMLGVAPEKVQVTAETVGGGFGGKEDMSVQHHAALLAHLTGGPVKVRLTRQESMRVHPKRHPMEMHYTVGCDENGYITGMKCTIVADTGAYASLGGPVLQRACTHAAGPYNFQDIDIDGKAIYTNNPPAGAFRGFGVTQSCFAMEQCLNQLAKQVGISPWEIRYRNAIRPGQVLPNGQIADANTALVETLEAVKDVYENSPDAGIACAMKNSGLGVGIPDVGRCRLQVIDGKVHIRSSAACIGQGLGTVLVQIVCTETGLPENIVVHDYPDTDIAPDAGNTTASRQTVFTGEAARRAAAELLTALSRVGGIEDLEGQSFYGEYASITDKLGSEKENPVSHVAYGYATQVVLLDEDGRLKEVHAAHDVGTAINPVSLEGQIEGGVVMSLGYALTEQFPLKNGVPTAKFGTLGLFKSPMTPDVKVYICGRHVPGLAFGAKGVGEICSIPTAPAVANAYEVFDGKFRSELPCDDTPYQKKKK